MYNYKFFGLNYPNLGIDVWLLVVFALVVVFTTYKVIANGFHPTIQKVN